MSRKRIVILGYAESVHIGRWTRALSGRGFDIKLVSLGGRERDGIETVVVSRRNKLSYITNSARVARIVRSLKPDLVHAHFAVGYGYWARKTGFSPTILSVWGTDITEFPSNPINRVILRQILGSVDHITATSRYLQERVVQIDPSLEKRISVIPFGVELPTADPVDPPVGSFNICFLKVHHKRYGPDILLKALKIAQERVPDVSLTMGGDGVMTPALRKLATDLGIDASVKFIGFIDNKEVPGLIQGHHAMAMPSLREAFGVAALEAAANGRAVIGTNVGGIPEVVLDGESGLLVEPGDANGLAEAIVKLALDTNLCKRMGQCGRRLVQERYLWEESVDQMSELYERLISERR